MFNVPPVVTATLAVLGAVHAVRALALSVEDNFDVLRLFAFIPVRYDASVLAAFPGGLAADIWTFVTYALIHADLLHLGVNGVWLLAFGSAVGRRFGASRFLAFFAVTAAAGAAAHLATHAGDPLPMVGASGAISGFMAAATRFVFQRGGPLGLLGSRDAEAYRVPAAPLAAALRDPRILTFLAAWFGLNALVGTGLVAIAGVEQAVAWQAHVGGFLAGLVGFAAFDPIGRATAADGEGGTQSGPTFH